MRPRLVGLLHSARRSMGTKDRGSTIEGHGGILDRQDAVTFTAPVFFHIEHYAFM
ncbi:MAG: phosphatidate cytidylyltransferase [Rhodanobacter sp.]